MHSVHTRTAAPTATLQLRAVAAPPTPTDADRRQFTALAVPWDTPTAVDWYGDGLTETFARGSLAPTPDMPVPLYVEHDRYVLPVGVLIETRDTTAGLEIVAELADTTAGRDAYEVIRMGALARVSIGFVPDSYEIDEAAATLTHTRALLAEVSLVRNPAYPAARITDVRSQPKESAMDKDELEAALEESRRRITILETRTGATGPAAPALRFSSLAEVVKGLADRSTTMDDLRSVQEAYAAARAATDSAASVLRPGWIDRDIRLLDKGRKVWGLFRHEPLPSEGMQIEYPVVKATTDGTADQEAEGDALGLVKLEVDTKTAPVATSGNYAELTRQAIDRATVPYLEKVLRLQLIGYAKHTERKARAALAAATGTGTGAVTDPTKAADWTAAVVRSAGYIDDTSVGLSAEFILCSLAVFEALVSIVDTTGRPIFAVGGDGSNTLGAASPATLSADVSGLPVYPWLASSETHAYVCSAEAISLLEAPGAPFQLADEDIASLVRAFALYGHTTSTLDDPAGIVKLTIG